MGNLNLINHLYLSENSRKIGTQLIKELSINRSNNLSLFLNVNKCFDDREATLVWTQHHLDQHIDDDYEDVKRAFLGIYAILRLLIE